MKRVHYIILGVILITIVVVFTIKQIAYSDSEIVDSVDNSSSIEEQIDEKQDRVEQVEIVDGSTYGNLMASAGIDPNVYMDLYNSAVDVYDLAKVRVGRVLNLTFDKDTDELKQLMYQIDLENELFVNLSSSVASPEGREGGITATTTETKWVAEIVPIEYDIEVVTEKGVVESSMYQAALDSGIDERAIVELANAFQWSLDFSMEVQTGDTFVFTYEKLYRDGQYVAPGKIIAGKFVNKGVPLYVFYFEEDDDNKGFFDQDGNSVQKMFLKAPVAYKYISSGFTTGRRYVAAFNVSTKHRAIDYAAAYGTPVRAVGNGSVTFSGWAGPYGNKVSIRHNGTYSTNYAHMSKTAVKKGQRVNQGDVIGYVGSTGFSTGPHVHYEMVKNGIKINPLKEVLPPGKSIKDENKDRFFKEINKYKEVLDK